jgi:hypothetical protein
MKQNKLISNQVVWIYNSKNDQNFFSTIGGSEQRLLNGNTLICSDSQGHLFEVTYGDGTNLPQLVWEYINPVTEDGIKLIITDQYPMYNSVFRAYRYTSDHPALAGRDLTPKGTITGRTPDYLTPENNTGNVSNASTLAKFVLKQNHPNPFNPKTMIAYQLQTAGDVQLKIYNLNGQEVKTLISEFQAPGEFQIEWNGIDNSGGKVSSGIYLYRLQIDNYILTKKMTLMQ